MGLKCIIQCIILYDGGENSSEFKRILSLEEKWKSQFPKWSRRNLLGKNMCQTQWFSSQQDPGAAERPSSFYGY